MRTCDSLSRHAVADCLFLSSHSHSHRRRHRHRHHRCPMCLWKIDNVRPAPWWVLTYRYEGSQLFVTPPFDKYTVVYAMCECGLSTSSPTVPEHDCSVVVSSLALLRESRHPRVVFLIDLNLIGDCLISRSPSTRLRRWLVEWQHGGPRERFSQSEPAQRDNLLPRSATTRCSHRPLALRGPE